MTMHRLRFAACALAGLALLAGCSSEKTQIDGWTQARAVLATLTAKRSTAPIDPGLTRAQVDGSQLPLILLTVENRNATAALARVNTNAGTETFITADGITVTTRDGVLISSRGLGNDLMSAAVPSRAQISAGSGSHRRVHDHLDGGDVTVRHAFDCTLAGAGSETVTVVGLSWPTRVVSESCTGDSGSFENRYWIDSRGIIRQSRQWVGADVGFLRLSATSR
jgi:hypothetical protein